MKTIQKTSKNLKKMNLSEMNQVIGGKKFIVITIDGKTYYIQVN